MAHAPLTREEFTRFQSLIYRIAGISMNEAKMVLVSGRLARRVDHFQLPSFGAYFDLLTAPGNGAELQVAIDLLTTNETFFFREPKHFQFLRDTVLPALPANRTVRIWSGACSSGEELYSIAMVLADRLGERPWELLGSDISTRVLERARIGHYPMERIDEIPPDYLKRFCLKGVGKQAGTFLVDKTLRQRVQVRQVNLNAPLPDLGQFDVVFLRNVMIYFDQPTKREVVRRVAATLRSGGYLLVSHSETLNGVNDSLRLVSPSIYRKP
jgi:chemotaxis protein methyltransferase CheR